MAYTMNTLIANRANYGSARNTGNIKYIVIHYTANDGDKAANNARYFHNNVVKASAHYFVDDTSVWQSVPDNYVAYAVGGSKWSNGGGRLYKVATNANTLSIELCDTVKNGTIAPTAATINNALALTRSLMIKYGVDKNHVIRHYDVTGKPCPKYWVSDSAWKSQFWNKIDQAAPAPSKPKVTVPEVANGIHRLYNPNSGEHFYTRSRNEAQSLVNAGWSYEGIGWRAPGSSKTPVYRVYNPNAGDHHFTISKSEKDHLVKAGWRDEGIAFYSDDAKGVAVYRQYNPNAKSGAHNFTVSKAENDLLVKAGWRAEGIAFYGMK